MDELTPYDAWQMDHDWNEERKRREARETLTGIECEHSKMSECHTGCGHWHCPDCGLEWDDASEN